MVLVDRVLGRPRLMFNDVCITALMQLWTGLIIIRHVATFMTLVFKFAVASLGDVK